MAGVVDSVPFLALALAMRDNNSGARRAGHGRRLVLFGLHGASCIWFTAKQGQTVGQMVLGIRVVDANTAALPTPMQAAVRWAVAMVPDALAQLLPLSQTVEIRLAAIRELQSEIDRLTRRYEGDREMLSEELMSPGPSSSK